MVREVCAARLSTSQKDASALHHSPLLPLRQQPRVGPLRSGDQVGVAEGAEAVGHHDLGAGAAAQGLLHPPFGFGVKGPAVCPSLGLSRPGIRGARVLLPEPLAPTSAK